MFKTYNNLLEENLLQVIDTSEVIYQYLKLHTFKWTEVNPLILFVTNNVLRT